MSGNSTSSMCSFCSAIFRAPRPLGARSGGQRMSCVPFVISSGRAIWGTSGERSMFSIARHACRTVYGSFSPTMSRTSWKMFSPSGLSMNRAPTACVVDVVGELVPRHRLGHAPPDAEERAPVDVRLRERDVGAGGDRLLRIRGSEGDRDHPAHRRAVDERALEPDCVEQRRRVARPALDRVRLARVVGGAVSARVEGEQPEALAEAVVDEAEVVAAEEPTAELQDRRARPRGRSTRSRAGLPRRSVRTARRSP